MKKYSLTTMKWVRNVLIIIGIVGGFIIWFFVPDTFKNTSFMHVGNGTYGSKYGMLVPILFPLFALLGKKKKLEFHSDDEEARALAEKEASRNLLEEQIAVALLEAVVAIGLMLFATTL
ncbi:MAG TPA: hypothetical protein VJY54_11220 [Lachnospiraceae bacterium]|nr:hypothetical protein [Lachnospiraceae bacterium]